MLLSGGGYSQGYHGYLLFYLLQSLSTADEFNHTLRFQNQNDGVKNGRSTVKPECRLKVVCANGSLAESRDFVLWAHNGRTIIFNLDVPY